MSISKTSSPTTYLLGLSCGQECIAGAVELLYTVKDDPFYAPSVEVSPSSGVDENGLTSSTPFQWRRLQLGNHSHCRGR